MISSHRPDQSWSASASSCAARTSAVLRQGIKTDKSYDNWLLPTSTVGRGALKRDLSQSMPVNSAGRPGLLGERWRQSMTSIRAGDPESVTNADGCGRWVMRVSRKHVKGLYTA